jgi:hypothetical protein
MRALEGVFQAFFTAQSFHTRDWEPEDDAAIEIEGPGQPMPMPPIARG